MHWLEGKGEIVNRTDSKLKLILGEITQTGIWLIDNVWKHCELSGCMFLYVQYVTLRGYKYVLVH